MIQYTTINRGEHKGLNELTLNEVTELISKEYNKHCVMHQRHIDPIIDEMDAETRFVYYANMSFLSKLINRLVKLIDEEGE